MNSQADTGSVPASPARGIAGQIAANISLLIAVLFYMGWAYDAAFYGYFHLDPFSLNLSIQEYILRSLDLFSTTIVIVAAAFIALAAARSWGLGKTKFALLAAGAAATRMSAIPAFRGLASTDAAERSRARRVILIGSGAAVTLVALALFWIANYVAVSSYLFLLLLGGGVLLLTWPTRTDRHGRFAYAMAIIVTAVCALWAASLYAHNLGTQAAKEEVQDLSGRAAVSVYSTARLALQGPGVIVQNIPTNYYYHYCYTGLRMLLMQSGTYYLLPVGWNPGLNLTYILTQSDLIRIDLGGAGCYLR